MRQDRIDDLVRLCISVLIFLAALSVFVEYAV